MKTSTYSKGLIYKARRIFWTLGATACLAILVAPDCHAGDGAVTVPSVLKAVTVYRNGAELTHKATAALRQGNNELVIEGLSNNIDIGSIRIGTDGNVTILSVEFSKEFLKPEMKSPMITRLQDSVETIQKELEKLKVLMKADNDLLDLLGNNKKIGGTQTGVTVAELSKMMDYYKQKSLELGTELSAGKEKDNRLNRSIERLDAQILEEDRKNAKTAGRLILQLLSPLARTAEFTISYLTPTAFWNPCYDLRVDNITKPIKLLYKAKLVQTSGIDWKQVKLILSTSVPSQGGNAPLLKTWFLRYAEPYTGLNFDKSNSFQPNLAGRVAGMQTNEVVVRAYGTSKIKGEQSMNESEEPLYMVNGKPMTADEFGKLDARSIKKTEILKDASATALYGSRAAGGVILVTLKEELGDYIAVNDNAMDVTFDIDLPYDVPSNGKEQNVALKEYEVPSDFKYYSAPKLDKDAYLLGAVPEWEKLNLLPGEANIIVEGTYIGKSYIDPNSTQDTLNLTLGRDKRVVVKREKVVDYSSVKFLGTNKKQIFTYEITVKNNKKEKIKMLLKDQYPISSNKEIEEDLLESSGADVNKDTGILTWKIELPAGESRKFRISYSVKYPKEKTVNAY